MFCLVSEQTSKHKLPDDIFTIIKPILVVKVIA